jgi:hypothetical protein
VIIIVVVHKRRDKSKKQFPKTKGAYERRELRRDPTVSATSTPM